jgi:hypothetical protein
LLQAGEVRVMQMKRMPDRFQTFARLRQILGIHIEADEQSVRSNARQQFCTVSRPADGAIDNDHAGLGIEGLQDFLKQHGAMFALRRAARFRWSSHGLHVFLANARIDLV